jgi:hypothetical protein
MSFDPHRIHGQICDSAMHGINDLTRRIEFGSSIAEQPTSHQQFIEAF